MCPDEETAEEVALLHRQLDRERRARRTAEMVGESATADLWHTVQELEAAQAELRAKAEQSELLHTLGREVRRDLDPQTLMRGVVAAVGTALDVDRCLIRLADEAGIGLVMEQWTRPGVAVLSRRAELTDDLAKLATSASFRQEGLWIDDVRTDDRLGHSASSSIREALGCEAYAGTPMLAGSYLVGWLVLHCTDGPRAWSARDRAVLSGVAHDLGGALLQALAHQDQLESVRKLREVDALKTEFVSRVSHELRTPLTSITGYLEMLAGESFGKLNPGQHKVLDIVQRNCSRLLNLTGNLLTLSRVDENELHLTHTDVDLREIVADVRHALTPALQERDLTLDIFPTPPTPGFTGDPREIERVLLNLLSNAIKFTPDGGRVTLATACSPESVVLVVSDTGHGISPADQVHLFRRFFRATNAIEMEIPGTGLGLSLVKATVDAHGGTLAVESDLGAGTTFTVTLPRFADLGTVPPYAD